MPKLPSIEYKVTLGALASFLILFITLLTMFWELSAKVQQYNDNYIKLNNHANFVDIRLQKDHDLLEKLNMKMDIIQNKLNLNLGDPK